MTGRPTGSASAAQLIRSTPMGCRQFPTRSLEPPATRGRMRADPSSPEVSRPPQRGARHRFLRHGRPIDRHDRARSFRTLVASGTAAAYCTGCMTTPLRRAPASSSASSRVGWTSELRSASELSSPAQLPTSTRADRGKHAAHGRRVVSRKATGRHVSDVPGGPSSLDSH